jgi:hypothetical protein
LSHPLAMVSAVCCRRLFFHNSPSEGSSPAHHISSCRLRLSWPGRKANVR